MILTVFRSCVLTFGILTKPLLNGTSSTFTNQLYYVNVVEQFDDIHPADFFTKLNCSRLGCDCDNLSVEMQMAEGWMPIDKLLNLTMRLRQKNTVEDYVLQVIQVLVLSADLVRLPFEIICYIRAKGLSFTISKFQKQF